MAQAPALGEVVSNTSAKERQHKCEALISEAITDEEYLAQLETKREEITHEILERCRTKRKNLYITGPVALNVAQKFSVHRLCDKEGKHNLANRFVGELMEQLVQDGLLVTTKTRNGPGVRTATDAEISSPLPGQQQMTL